MAEDEGEDFVYYGTPIEHEADTSSRKRKSIADAGHLRSLPTWKQEVDPHGKLDPGVEDLLLEIADDFIDSVMHIVSLLFYFVSFMIYSVRHASHALLRPPLLASSVGRVLMRFFLVTTFACGLAKHRKSSTLEPKDLLLHLEKNWHLTIPGFTKEGQKYRKEPLEDMHSKCFESIRASMESLPYERDATRSTGRQGMTDSSLNHPLKPSLSSEQLILSAAASQMLQKAPRF